MIGPVELSLPPKLARQLLSAPEIPRNQLMEVSRRLGQRLPERHHGLLPAAPATAVQIEEQPVPILRLRLGRMRESSFYYRDPRASNGPVAVAQLGFRYGPIEFDPSERGSRLEAFHAGQVYAIKRRQPKEKEARKPVTDLGFVAAASKFPFLDSDHARDLTLGDPYDWFDFLDLEAAELRAQGSRSRSATTSPIGWRHRATSMRSSNPAASIGSNWLSESKSMVSGAILRRCWPRWSRSRISLPT